MQWTMTSLALIVASLALGCGPIDEQGPEPQNAQPVQNGQGENAIILDSVKVNDPIFPKCTALTLLVPQGWKTAGGIVWDWNRAFLCDLEMRVYDPHSARQVEFLPQMSFTWGNPFLTRGMSYSGGEVQPLVTDPKEFVAQYIVPRHRRGARVVSEKLMPDVAAASLATDPTGIGRAYAGRVRLEYVHEGQAMEEDVYVILFSLQTSGSPLISWLGTGFAIRSAKGKLDDDSALLLAVAHSRRFDIQWYADYQQAVQIMQQSQMYAIEQTAVRNNIMRQARAEISATIVETYRKQQATNDRVNQQFSNYVRGVEQYHSPFQTYAVQLPSGYNQVWGNSQGQYLLSNSASFNPNQSLQGNWQQLKAVR